MLAVRGCPTMSWSCAHFVDEAGFVAAVHGRRLTARSWRLAGL